LLKTKIIAGLVGLAGLFVSVPSLANVAAPLSLRPSFDGDANWLRGNPIVTSARTLATIDGAIQPWGLWIAPAATEKVASLNAPKITSAHLDSSTYGVFGSVALPISAVPASKQWRSISATDYTLQFGASCHTVACSTGIGGTLGRAARMAATENAFEGLALINSSVNNLIKYRADGADHWATPVETAARGAGDCEDFAIAKMWLLRSIGYPRATLHCTSAATAQSKPVDLLNTTALLRVASCASSRYSCSLVVSAGRLSWRICESADEIQIGPAARIPGRSAAKADDVRQQAVKNKALIKVPRPPKVQVRPSK